MYITETTENVRKLFETIDSMEDTSKFKFVLYVMEQIYNNHINDKNELNPTVFLDDIIVINEKTLGFKDNPIETFLEFGVMRYNTLNGTKISFLDGHILGIKYDDVELDVIKIFEDMSFNEKLEIISELFIRIDNETYYNSNDIKLKVFSDINGFDIAKLILNFKESE